MQTYARLFAGLALMGLVTAPAVTIETAFTRYYQEGDIRPIGQYFGSKLSQQGFRTVLASQPGEPAGQYFIIRLKEWKSADIASARMTLYATDSKEPSTRTWELGQEQLDDWLYLGLTGDDWPGTEIRPLAWRVELLGNDERVLAEWKSFLWEMPE